jgi:8-oxo-dGTP pyrophosphatase MutT (NUDIX family)
MASKRFSAGAVILRAAVSEWRYLLLRVYRTWDFPKGGLEAGESPLQAAIREVEEETALTDLEFRWGEVYCETEPYSGGKVARYYLAVSRGDEVSLLVNPELGRPEHHEFRWVGYLEAKRLLPPRLQPILEWAEVTGRPDKQPST